MIANKFRRIKYIIRIIYNIFTPIINRAPGCDENWKMAGKVNSRGPAAGCSHFLVSDGMDMFLACFVGVLITLYRVIIL